MLDVKVLGSVAPYPKGDKKCPGFLINYNENKYLFDLGNGAISNMELLSDLKRLKIFITHFHPDHYGDLSALANAALVFKKLGYTDNNIDIYLPENEKRIDTVYIPGNPYNHDDWGSSVRVERDSYEFEYLKSILSTCPLNIKEYSHLNYKEDDLSVVSILTSHPGRSSAFRLECNDGVIVYSGDSGYNKALADFAKDADLFICESSFLRGQYREDNHHMYAYEAALLAKEANVNKLLLTHFWPEIEKEEYLREAKEVFSNTMVAEEGKVLTLRR